MLMLTRSTDEALMIGNEIIVTVLEVKGARFVLASMYRQKLPFIAARFLNGF